jgi:hypothetical protein
MDGSVFAAGFGCLSSCPLGYVTTSQGTCTLPLEYVTSKFMSDGGSILLEIGGVSLTRANTVTLSDCSAFIVRNATDNLFGSSPKCTWTSSTTLRISCSGDAQAKPGSTFAIYKTMFEYVLGSVPSNVLAASPLLAGTSFPNLANPAQCV